MSRRGMVAVAVISAFLLAGGSTSAGAAESTPDVDPLITAMLEQVPGGVVVDDTRVVWPRLDMELLVQAGPEKVARTVESCAIGRICAYTALSLGGNALTFGTCGNHTIPSSFSAKSLANARTSGYVQGRSGSTVIATVPAGSWANVAGGITSVRCYL